MDPKALEKIVGMARQFLETDGSLAPAAFIGGIRGVGVVQLDMSTVEAKDASASFIRQFAAKQDADFVVLVLETWRLPESATKDFMANRSKYPTVSSHPDKEECVMVSVETHAGTKMGMAKITREGGKPTFGEIEWQPPSVENRGRFTNFLSGKKAQVH